MVDHDVSKRDLSSQFRPSAPHIHLLPPKASWVFWRDFWGAEMLQNPKFPAPDPTALGAPPDSLTDGEGLAVPLSRTPTPLSALRASLYGCQGYRIQSWQPY